MFAMEKKAISVDQVKENFSINGEQAESVIKQLETCLLYTSILTQHLKQMVIQMRQSLLWNILMPLQSES